MSADLDNAIDRVVREMLDVEPPADLRAKVIARIDERPASSFQVPAFSFQRLAAVGGTAALVALVLGLALVRRAEPPAQPPAIAGAQAPEPLPVAATPQPPIGVPAAPTPLAVTARTAVAQTPARVAYAAPADRTQAAAIDPLTAITPIGVAPIDRSSITPEPIGVRPLDRITEMQIAPLSPPDERD